MLIELKVTNFRSIREQQTFSLVASNAVKELPDCVIERDLPGLSSVKFLRGAAIYGANASGKSNIIQSLEFVSSFVRRSAVAIQPGEQTGAQPFKLDKESPEKPSEFEVTFVANGTRFVFGFSLTAKRVVEEYLVAYPNGTPQRWYHRNYVEATGSYKWAKPSTSFKQDKSLQDKTRENSLFLSVGPQFNHEQLTQVFNWFKNDIKFIQLGAEQPLNVFSTGELLNESSFRERIINLIKSADIGIANATVGEKKLESAQIYEEAFFELPGASYIDDNTTIPPGGWLLPHGTKKKEIKLFHKVEKGEPVSLDFDKEESLGTRRFFSLIGPWLEMLEKGATVFIDEIETSLHPILVRELLKLLFCKKNNPKGAQVVFTTHNPILLDGALMRRDQIWFTEKTPAGATHLYPLTDYSPRQDEALAKGYLAGRYGAIPFMPEGLQL